MLPAGSLCCICFTLVIYRRRDGDFIVPNPQDVSATIWKSLQKGKHCCFPYSLSQFFLFQRPTHIEQVLMKTLSNPTDGKYNRAVYLNCSILFCVFCCVFCFWQQTPLNPLLMQGKKRTVIMITLRVCQDRIECELLPWLLQRKSWRI